MTIDMIAIYMLAGAFGGLLRTLVTGKGIVALPRLEHVDGGSLHLNLGFLAPMTIGAGAGLLAPWSLGINGVFSILSGYVGPDFIENLIERQLPQGTPK